MLAKDLRGRTYLTLNELAQEYHVHHSTIRRWVSAGHIPVYRRSGNPDHGVRYVWLEEVEALVKTKAKITWPRQSKSSQELVK